jgi:hypothetical protein
MRGKLKALMAAAAIAVILAYCYGPQSTPNRGSGFWSHYSDSVRMGVGGDGRGCTYTTVGWSNC